MAVIQNNSLSKIISFLPSNIKNALNRLDTDTLSKINEIRLRADRACTITLNGENCVLSQSGICRDIKSALGVTGDDIDGFIYKLCRGSIYSYEPTLKEAFITRFGIRIGLSGVFGVGANSGSFSKIKGINIRLPRHIDGCSKGICDYLSQNGFPQGKGILIASPPGVGKTTLLRDLSLKLSSSVNIKGENTFLRVCVIDERNEIFMDNIFKSSACDFLSSVPKPFGIETASRVLNPQVIICDEIGTEAESTKILSAHSGGIILIASVHADSLEAINARAHIKALIDGGVFGAAYILQKTLCGVEGKMFELNKCSND